VRPARSRPAARRAVLALLAVGTIAGACSDLGTGVGDVSYVVFDGVPYPALLAGDTMRDAAGLAAPLRAHAFDADGDSIPGAGFTYFALDTGVAIAEGGLLRATGRRDGTIRLVASYRGLQTTDVTVRVTRRPDSVAASGASTVSLALAIPDNGANAAPEMRIKLLSDDTVGVGAAVPGWIVRWRAVHGTDTIAATDTQLVALQSAAGTRGVVDTTGADGTAARRLRVFAERLTALTDSFVVLADVRLHGTPVAGSPVRFLVRVAPP